MADPEITDSPASDQEVTPQGEEPTSEATAESQETAAKLAQLESQLQEYKTFETRYSEAQKNLEQAQSKAEELERRYKGLQRETGPKLQDYARLRQQNAEIVAARQELADMKQTVDFLAGNLVDESAREQLTVARERARLRREQEAIQRDHQAQQAQRQYVDPEEYRKRVYEYYAGESEVPFDHPEIDWGERANNPQEAVRRFTSSIRKIERKMEGEKAQTLADTIRQSTEAALKQQVDELRNSLTEARKQAEEAANSAKEQARVEEETRNRRNGVDRSGAAASEGKRQVRTELAEELDESLLYKGPAGVSEYNKRLAALRDKALRGR